MESQENLNKLIEYGAIHLGSGVTNLKAIRGGGGISNFAPQNTRQRYSSLDEQLRLA